MAQLSWTNPPRTGNPEMDQFLDHVLALLKAFQVLGEGIVIRAGSGAPDFAAKPGSLYVDTAGGDDATLWVKEANTDGTGWVSK